MTTVAVYSVKGGVGKTSAAVNLAWCAAQSHRVLLWDLDPQGGATYLLRAKPRAKGDAHDVVRRKAGLADLIRRTSIDGLDVVPAHDSYRSLDLELDATKAPEKGLARVLDHAHTRHDVVVLDSPPGMSVLAEAVLVAADVVVVPLVPSPLSMRSLEQVEEMVASAGRRKPRIVGFLSMVDRRKTVHRELVERLPAESAHVVDVVVPYSTLVERMGAVRAPIADIAPTSAPAQAYGALWAAVSSVAALDGRGSGKASAARKR